MITAVTIENFKGIGEPVRLELRPITLLFGANSAGKSSILHALIYAREIFERHNLDPDHTLTADEHLDLGGFAGLIHNQDRSKPMRLRFALDLTGIDLPGSWDYYDDSEFRDPEFVELSQRVEKVEVACTICWSNQETVPFVRSYWVDINGHGFARIGCEVPGRGATITYLHSTHPVFNASETATRNDSESVYFKDLLDETSKWMKPVGGVDEIGLQDQWDALPDFDRLERSSIYPLRTQAAADETNWDGDTIEFYQARPGLTLLERILYQLLVGPGLLLRQLLSQFRYLGPLRQVPPRGYSPPRNQKPSRWTNGLAGWDLLFRSPQLIRRVSRLLADPEKMNLGYRLEEVESREYDSSNPFFQAIQANRSLDDIPNLKGWIDKGIRKRRLLFRPLNAPEVTLEAADLGVGVSQMIPVLAAVLDTQSVGSSTEPVQLVAVEHPELNLHPRLQAELADVFLEGALSEQTRGRIFFIETHSEVFTLRLFRRIRESNRKPPDPNANDDTMKPVNLDFVVKPTEVGLWYVDRTEGIVTVKRMPVDIEGELIHPWPENDSLFEQDFRERYS